MSDKEFIEKLEYRLTDGDQYGTYIIEENRELISYAKKLVTDKSNILSVKGE